jgi:tetratricopeptide (TPR) repeat protein
MKRGFWIALVLASSLVAIASLYAQTPAGGGAAQSGQSKQAGDAQKPAAAQPQTGSNPFPEDTSSVPVMPSKTTPDLPPGTFTGSERDEVSLPGEDQDPVRSPEDPATSSAGGQEQDSSSSSSAAGLDSLLPTADDDQPGKRKKKGTEAEPTHQETAGEDLSVGKYYLESKNWRAAQSRFQSALVLAPEDPDVYWGLAESARHLGDFAAARANYLKVIEYDPDSRHAKEAAKALKEPDLAHAKASAPGQPASGTR